MLMPREGNPPHPASAAATDGGLTAPSTLMSAAARQCCPGRPLGNHLRRPSGNIFPAMIETLPATTNRFKPAQINLNHIETPHTFPNRFLVKSEHSEPFPKLNHYKIFQQLLPIEPYLDIQTTSNKFKPLRANLDVD